GDAPGAGRKARIGGIDADGGVEAGIVLRVAQAIDAVAHHQTHGAGVVIGPDGLGPVPLLGGEEPFRREIKRVVPGDRLPLPGAPVALAAQRLGQTRRMMDALRVARHLGTDDARRVVVVGSATHAANGMRVENLDLERAGRRAIVGAGRGADDCVHVSPQASASFSYSSSVPICSRRLLQWKYP